VGNKSRNGNQQENEARSVPGTGKMRGEIPFSSKEKAEEAADSIGRGTREKGSYPNNKGRKKYPDFTHVRKETRKRSSAICSGERKGGLWSGKKKGHNLFAIRRIFRTTEQLIGTGETFGINVQRPKGNKSREVEGESSKGVTRRVKSVGGGPGGVDKGHRLSIRVKLVGPQNDAKERG